ncbi:hypothetical protein FDI69_gp219 [Rhodococcus phage Trina]|uniref:Uncharacterized protein n=1 Tax=Rhodococcus phage Trina TaxID=2027905 RepID=A0A2D1AE48_9CAUD|nr:hypothetical protein FDI69_gp219 [Rhodococcus phage Trina]ASZ74967.1 hypothetical protein SEA_TRINA_183 [Rhodococcus phage Trina]
MVSRDKQKKHHYEGVKAGWHYSGVQRRDFRNSHDGPEETGPPRGKKPSKSKYCKRNDYKQHEYVFHYYRWHTPIYSCVHCGRQQWRFAERIPYSWEA